MFLPKKPIFDILSYSESNEIKFRQSMCMCVIFYLLSMISHKPLGRFQKLKVIWCNSMRTSVYYLLYFTRRWTEPFLYPFFSPHFWTYSKNSKTVWQIEFEELCWLVFVKYRFVMKLSLLIDIMVLKNN